MSLEKLLKQKDKGASTLLMYVPNSICSICCQLCVWWVCLVTSENRHECFAGDSVCCLPLQISFQGAWVFFLNNLKSVLSCFESIKTYDTIFLLSSPACKEARILWCTLSNFYRTQCPVVYEGFQMKYGVGCMLSRLPQRGEITW